jgi:hypothetical protein
MQLASTRTGRSRAAGSTYAGRPSFVLGVVGHRSTRPRDHVSGAQDTVLGHRNSTSTRELGRADRVAIRGARRTRGCRAANCRCALAPRAPQPREKATGPPAGTRGERATHRIDGGGGGHPPARAGGQPGPLVRSRAGDRRRSNRATRSVRRRDNKDGGRSTGAVSRARRSAGHGIAPRSGPSAGPDRRRASTSAAAVEGFRPARMVVGGVTGGLPAPIRAGAAPVGPPKHGSGIPARRSAD